MLTAHKHIVICHLIFERNVPRVPLSCVWNIFHHAFWRRQPARSFWNIRKRAQILRPCCLYKSYNQVALCGSDETQRAFYTLKFVQDVEKAMDDESTVGSLNSTLSVFIWYRKCWLQVIRIEDVWGFLTCKRGMSKPFDVFRERYFCGGFRR